ncbi:MAG: adenosine kinase [Tannerella sp.]|jgi:sugar/nucleoside kinase (ribokinase family)|nr:adenosine kinase [Tannerella sp.]
MKVLGIGNALLDVLLRIENDNTLAEIGIQKGAMDLIQEDQMRAIHRAQAGLLRNEAPGGSVCNTMRAMACLGAEAGYIGKVGTDANGAFYEQAIRKAGVTPHIVRTEGITGCCTVLISPDGERTMATFLGPAATLSASEISDDLFDGYACLYIEGYLISNDALFLPILQRAKNAGLKIALDLSNFNIVNGYKGLLSEVIPRYVQILFSNEIEAAAYTGLNAEEAARMISKQIEVSVVTVGKRGAFVGCSGESIAIPATGRKPVDTTGAGDHFAAGFLFGLSQKTTLCRAAQIGSLLAGHVIETVGPQIPDELWSQIKLKVEKMSI